MSVYIIARFKIHDRSEYDRYSAGFPAVFQQFDGTMLSVDEDPSTKPSRNTATLEARLTRYW
jgi:uncharacterized protein (DUF1330 family)